MGLTGWPGPLLPTSFVRIGTLVGYKVQSDAVLEESLEACKRPGEPLSRLADVFDEFISSTRPTRLRDDDIRRCVWASGEFPFHRSAAAVSVPLDQDALVGLDGFYPHQRRR